MTVELRGYITVPADRLDAVKTALAEHIHLTRAEPGCLSFDVTEDPDIPGRFNVAETFVDADAFNTHQQRGANSNWAKVSEGVPRSYEITGLGEDV